MDFGATGDGVTDDTAAIQAALTAIARVYFPTGEYKITAQLNLIANQYITGDGEGSSLVFSGSMATDNLIRASAVNDIHIEGIKLTGDQTVDSVLITNGCGMHISGNTRVKIKDCIIWNFPQAGILVDNVSQFEISGCNIKDIYPVATATSAIAGISVQDLSTDGLLTNNYINNIGLANGDTGIGIRMIIDSSNNPFQIRCSENQVQNIATHGMAYYNNGTVDESEGMIIANNIVRNTGMTTSASTNLGNGIYVLGNGGVQVLGNRVENTQVNTGASSVTDGSIVINSTITTPLLSPAIVANNTVVNSTEDGISIQASRAVVSNNSLYNITGVAIKGQGNATTRTKGLVITGNTGDSTAQGIHILKFDDITISGNSFYGIGGKGINVDNVNRCSITGNNLYGDAGSGDIGIQVQQLTAPNTNTSVSINGNVVENFHQACQVYSVTNGTMSGNTFVLGATPSRGVLWQSCTNFTGTGNTITGDNTVEMFKSTTAATNCLFADNTMTVRAGKTTPYINNAVDGCTVRAYGGTDPATDANGSWRVGDVVLDNTPTAGGSIGSVCTTAGSPGTWKTFGAITA